MKHTKGKWEASKRFDLKKNLVGISISDTEKKIGVMITYSSKQLPMDEVQANANLIASAPEMLELLKDILAEVRPEISRVNEVAGHTIFNPVATETIDMAKELIDKAEREDK